MSEITLESTPSPAAETTPEGRLLSLIVPVYFEQECIAQFISETTAVLETLPERWEIVFIDDGSADETVPLIRRAAAEEPRLKLVELSYNHGKQAALTAGISHAAGDLMLMMDPDLQDPPVEIPRFLAEIDQGYDLVFGVRAEKRDSLVNVLLSRAFWWTLERFTGLALPRGLAVMRIFNRAFAERFLRYREQNRFIEGIFMHAGMRRSTIVVSQRARFAGVSKFNLSRKIDLALTAILDFSDLPLRLTMRFGLLLILLGILLVLALVVLRLAGVVFYVGWPSIIAALAFGFGAQIFLMGVIGQYVGKIYRESKHRPLFSVKAVTNLPTLDGRIPP